MINFFFLIFCYSFLSHAFFSILAWHVSMRGGHHHLLPNCMQIWEHYIYFHILRPWVCYFCCCMVYVYVPIVGICGTIHFFIYCFYMHMHFANKVLSICWFICCVRGPPFIYICCFPFKKILIFIYIIQLLIFIKFNYIMKLVYLIIYLYYKI